MKAESLIDAILELSPDIRHVALQHRFAEPMIRDRAGSSADAEDERWDERVVNPTLLELAGRRGDVDLGGLDYLVVRYQRATNLLFPLEGGHLSVLLGPDVDPLTLVPAIRAVAARHGAAPPTR
jgi:hypothetical protein